MDVNGRNDDRDHFTWGGLWLLLKAALGILSNFDIIDDMMTQFCLPLSTVKISSPKRLYFTVEEGEPKTDVTETGRTIYGEASD